MLIAGRYYCLSAFAAGHGPSTTYNVLDTHYWSTRVPRLLDNCGEVIAHLLVQPLNLIIRRIHPLSRIVRVARMIAISRHVHHKVISLSRAQSASSLEPM